MTITLDDVIRHRDLISPREAVTLTLAIGNEWDRCRAHLGNVPLPSPEAIQLQQNGDIRFAGVIESGTAVSANPLSALLTELLGLDRETGPTQPIPGGLLITMAGRLGSMELPSVNESGFRSTLARFADPDPRTLRKVFWRLAGEQRRAKNTRSAAAHATPRRRRDRRAQPRGVAELRREIRQFERELFESGGARVRRPRLDRSWPGIRTMTAVVSFAILAFAITSVEPGSRASAAPEPLPVSVPPTDSVV